MYNENTTTAIYDVNGKSRCLCPQTAEKQLSRFFVGTLLLRESNQIHQIEVDEEVTEAVTVATYEHGPEIWFLTSSPHRKDFLMTAYNASLEFGASLWKIYEEEGKIEELFKLPKHNGSINTLLWHPAEEKTIASLDDNNINLWDVEKKENIVQFDMEEDLLMHGQWNNYFKDLLVASTSDDLFGYDIRAKNKTFHVKNAHNQNIRDIDLIRNNPYFIITCGDDCQIKIWDTRNLNEPKIIVGHSHWIWNIEFNPFDSLLISSSTDGTVNLWNVGSLTFNKDINQNINRSSSPHRLVKVYDNPESVYSISWSE